MKTHPQEILIIYNSDSSEARKTLAYAHTLSKHVKELDYAKSQLTATLWKQLLTKLSMEPKSLFDKSSKYYQHYLRGRAFDDEGWLNIIINNTHLIKAPIVVKGDKAILCTSPTQIFSLLQVEEMVVAKVEIRN